MRNLRSQQLGSLLLPSLHLHLLDFNGVCFAAADIHVVITHAKCQDGLVDPHMVGNKHKVWGFLICGLDDKVFVVESDVADLRPGEADFGGQPIEEEIRDNKTMG